MNAITANNEMPRLMPAGLSDRGLWDDAYLTAGDAAERHAGRSLVRRIVDGLAWLAAMPRRSEVMSELSTLSDHELADIGLARCDLKRVFDPSFAREHALRRGTCEGLTPRA